MVHMLGLTQIFGKEKVVGVDIGSRFIKAVQVEPEVSLSRRYVVLWPRGETLPESPRPSEH